MKIAGGMSYIVGPMGSGKTLRAVRGITKALCNHNYVVTNVPLKEDWPYLIARHAAPFASRAKRQRIADKLQRFYLFAETLDDAQLILTQAGFPGTKEGRVKWYWDESHNDLNNRTWQGRSADEQKRAKQREERVDLLEVTTQFRKLGIEGYLLSQHTDNTDAQIRRTCNFVIRMQNQREQTRMLGIRVTPWPLFLAFWYPANVVIGKTQPLQIERYFLSWHRHLYDTMSLYHGLKGSEQGRFELPPEGLNHSVEELLAILRNRKDESVERELQNLLAEGVESSEESAILRGSIDPRREGIMPKMQVPVTSSLVSAEQVEAMIADFNALEAGEAATDGETYDSRAKANNIASTYLRLMRQKGVEARSRTFELSPGAFTFGILHPTNSKPTEEDAPEAPAKK
jgi:hypothetical protein